MKKLQRLTAALGAFALALSFAACSWEEGGAPAGIENPFTQGRDNGNNGSGSTTSTATVKAVDKGASYSEDVAISLRSATLSQDGIAALSVGTDVTDLFVMSEVLGSSSSASASRAALADTEQASLSTSLGLSDFTAVVKSVSATSFTITLTAKTPTADCKIVISVALPADYTEEGVAVVQNVKVLNVGAGAGEVSSASMNLSSPVKLADIAGKTIKRIVHEAYAGNSSEENIGDFSGDYYREYYYVFKEDGTVTRYKYYYESSTSAAPYEVSDENCTLTDEGKLYRLSHSGELKKFYGILYKNGDTYYLLDDDAFPRRSGSGLFATYGEQGTEEESREENGVTVKYKWTYDFSLDICSDGTVSGYETETAYRNGEKFDSAGAALLYTGTFVNEGGYLNADIKAVVSLVDDNGRVYNEAAQFNAGFVYDGTELYGAEKCELYTGELPTVVSQY